MTGRVDLHRHLDGSLRPDTGAELAAQRGLRVPDDLLFFPGMGLEAALARSRSPCPSSTRPTRSPGWLRRSLKTRRRTG